MQMSKTLRSAVSLCVSLAMLVGMLAVFGAFPVAAAKSVEKFTANFSALPTGTVSMTDTDTVKYLEDRFAFYHFQEGWYFERPDVNGYVIDENGNNMTTQNTSATPYLPDVVDKKAASASKYVDGATRHYGFSYWKVSGAFMGCSGYACTNAFRKFNSMWVKNANGDLATLNNFQLEVDVKTADSALADGGTLDSATDALAVVFRAAGAGNIRSAEQQVVSFSANGNIFVGAGNNKNPAFSEKMTYNDAAVTLTSGRVYHLTLTVVGTQLQMILTDSTTGKAVYVTTRQVKDLGSGYLGIGGANAGFYYANIAVTRLDKDGNPVDFNDANDGYGFGADFMSFVDYRDGKVDSSNDRAYSGGTYFRDLGTAQEWLSPVGYGTKTYDFANPTEYATDKAVAEYLAEKFDFYYNRESTVTQFATPYENSVTQDADAEYGAGKTAQWKLQDGRYLNAVFTGQGNEILRKTVSIVPKDSDGEQVVAKDIETEFDMYLTTTAKTGVAFTFRAAAAGHLTTGWKASTGNKVTVIFTAGGYQVYEGVIPQDDCVAPTVNAWANGASVTKAHVYIKAVDNILTMKVTGADGTVYYAGSTELTHTAEGTMFYSVLNGTGGFANIRANRLNADGTVATWDAPKSLATNINVSTRPSYTIAKGDGVAEQLDAMFNAYYDADGTLTKTGGFPTTATSGAYWKGIYERTYLECTTSAANKTSALKSVGLLVPKTADGKEAVLKNFELSFTTRWAEMTFNNASVGGVVIGFRQQTAGKITTGAGQVNKNQGLIVITSTGISIAGGNEITDAMYGTANEQSFATELNPKASSDLSYHKVTVRVVGNQVTVQIGNNTYTDTVNYTEAGYLAFGPGAFRMHFSNIKVTRLDDAGNVIDWNTDQYESIPTKVSFNGSNLLGGLTSNKYVNGKDSIEYTDAALTVAQRLEYIEAFDNAFDVYYSDFDGTNAVYLHNASVVGNTVGYNYGKLQWYNKHAWMRPSAAASGYGSLTGSALRQVGSLVPKDADGEQLYLKNFDLTTSFAFWTGSTGNGAVVVGFRQAEPGRYFSATGAAATGDYLMVTNEKVFVYEDGVLKHENTLTTISQGGVRNLSIKVVGKQLIYNVTWNGSSFASGTVELSTEKTGYLSLAHTHYLRAFSSTDFSVTALDDLGQETPIKKPASTHTNGNVAVSTTVNDGVYTNVITVTPEEGYELLAGSLIATDAAGDTYVPQRVGFRNGGDASRYEVKCASPVKVTATFYQPTVADPNVGNIGTSINEELAGLRFVSRLPRTVNGDAEYVTLDGETFEVSDYGMLVALKSVLGTDTLSLDITETNRYVKKLSVKDSQIYYDFCDDYVDMSVCITGVDKVVGGTELEVVARPYAIAKDKNGEDVKLYAKSFSSTYAENAGLSVVTFSELEKDGKVKVLGRADVVGNDLQMDWVNTGFEIKGTVTGSVKVNMSSARADSLLNVSVDGKAPTIIHVPNGTSTVTLASGLSKGEHTIRVESGTSIRQGTLTATSLQYLGELNANANEQSRLKIEVLGDSISCGWGLDGNNSMSTSSLSVAEQVAISNSYYSYAAQTARLLDADLQVVAQCAQTIPAVHGFFPNLNKRSGAPKWDFENNQQDIVIINLGTNDEWQGVGLSKEQYSAENSLANIKALLSDVREAYPDAYIIYVYGMMRKTYEPQYQQAINEMNDDKALYVDMTAYKSSGGFDGNHPKRDSHTAVANALASFIRANCSDLFGHTTQTETMTALSGANKVLFTDRTAAEGTARRMTYSNTGMTVEGYLYGELKMQVNVQKETCALNVIVDGDVANATTVWVEAGDKEVTLLEDLRRGYHTVEIVKGTAHHAGALMMKDLTYTGTLTTPTAKELQIEFIGDSVTVGEGMYGNVSPLAKSYNSIDCYASQVARYLNAGVTTVAQCGAKIPGMTTQFNAMQDGEKDIVVINMGTNDFGWSQYASYDITTDCYPDTTTTFVSAITGLVDDVRAEQPDAYIIWTYGMMFDLHVDALEGIINDYATATNDDKLLFCDLSAAKDNSGKSSHPSTMGNNYAALVLTGFIRENCAELLTAVPTPEKTFATDRKLKVACVGDSITAQGYWQNNMRGELSTDKYEVSGFGVSGSTALFKGVDYVNESTNAGKAYVDQTAYTNALAYGADIVVIMLGTNDSKKVNWPYYADEFIDNYTEIVRSFQKQDNAPMVFIGLPPTVYSTGSFQDISNSRIENFIIPALYEVAARTGAVIVDTHTPTGGDSTLMTDGVHPGDAGKQILCETFAAAITAKVEG